MLHAFQKEKRGRKDIEMKLDTFKTEVISCIFTFSKQAFNESYDLFANVHSPMKDIHLIDSC